LAQTYRVALHKPLADGAGHTFFEHVISKPAINQFRALLVGTIDDPGECNADSEQVVERRPRSEVSRRAATRSEPAAL